MKAITKAQWLYIIIAVVIVPVAIVISLFFKRDAVQPPPNEYKFGIVSPFYAPILTAADYAAMPNSTRTALAIINLSGATAQIVTLGQKPLLRIENMNVSACPVATVFLSRSLGANGEDRVSLGNVRFPTGNTNYEIPLLVKYSEFPVVVVWCDSFNVTVGYALFS